MSISAEEFKSLRDRAQQVQVEREVAKRELEAERQKVRDLLVEIKERFNVSGLDGLKALYEKEQAALEKLGQEVEAELSLLEE